MRIAFPQTDEENAGLAFWLKRRIPDLEVTEYRTLAFMDDEKITGVVLYHNYRETDIEIVFAAEGKWARRDLIAAALTYPFSIGCNRISAIVEKNNKKIRKMLKQLGFVEEGKIRRASRDGSDMFLYGLLPEDFRLRKNYGQEVPSESANAS